MNLKYILIVWGAMLFCVGCSEDDVDSSYSFDVAGLKATVTNDKGSVVEMNTILLDSLQQQGFGPPRRDFPDWYKPVARELIELPFLTCQHSLPFVCVAIHLAHSCITRITPKSNAEMQRCASTPQPHAHSGRDVS